MSIIGPNQEDEGHHLYLSSLYIYLFLIVIPFVNLHDASTVRGKRKTRHGIMDVCLPNAARDPINEVY